MFSSSHRDNLIYGVKNVVNLYCRLRDYSSVQAQFLGLLCLWQCLFQNFQPILSLLVHYFVFVFKDNIFYLNQNPKTKSCQPILIRYIGRCRWWHNIGFSTHKANIGLLFTQNWKHFTHRRIVGPMDIFPIQQRLDE